MSTPIKDISGQKFGHLTALYYAFPYRNRTLWACSCDCGSPMTILARLDMLQAGKKTNCPMCSQNEQHRSSKTKLYGVFNAMNRRCHCENDPSYINYGGRGISVCNEWRNSFISFQKWALENGYREGLSLDRINNDGNYEPSNCRFVTRKIQNSNHRRNNRQTINGITKTFQQWAEEYNIDPNTIYARMRRGYSFYDALVMPVQGRASN